MTKSAKQILINFDILKTQPTIKEGLCHTRFLRNIPRFLEKLFLVII